jgi:hypothetical protein
MQSGTLDNLILFNEITVNVATFFIHESMAWPVPHFVGPFKGGEVKNTSLKTLQRTGA